MDLAKRAGATALEAYPLDAKRTPIMRYDLK